MGTITWVGLIIIVAVVAFLLGAYITKKQFKQDELEQQAKQAEHALDQYRQDVADHLASTGKLVSKMKDNYDQLLSHVEETNQLLLTDKKDAPAEPYFSKETTEQLQASLKERQSDRSSAQAQPADYVSGESGLFVGTKKESESAKAS
ncbi:YhcB family protein [Pseudoalteromonas sp. MMG010]|uniref:YhcB family protein n=1 Tax=Pseudoalteromonas sp. MMG010 TaxID=2822685 RepID=UPI001B3A6ED5|nr:YhcB family protein [Pseudoalteromonas sp. MMG010]MBQ4832794.1 YhcB family protein [Pseudoalteromonas sp. MMG010]